MNLILPKLKELDWAYNWWNSVEYTNWKVKIVWDYNKLKQYNVTADRLSLLLMWMKNTTNYIPNGITIKK